MIELTDRASKYLYKSGGLAVGLLKGALKATESDTMKKVMICEVEDLELRARGFKFWFKRDILSKNWVVYNLSNGITVYESYDEKRGRAEEVAQQMNEEPTK